MVAVRRSAEGSKEVEYYGLDIQVRYAAFYSQRRLQVVLEGRPLLFSEMRVFERPVALQDSTAREERSFRNMACSEKKKQKVKRAYGMLEKQFKEYFNVAAGMKGVTGTNMLSLLERRLDNVVYRMGIIESRARRAPVRPPWPYLVNGKRWIFVVSRKRRRPDRCQGKSASLEIQGDCRAGGPPMPKWLEFDPTKLQRSRYSNSRTG